LQAEVNARRAKKRKKVKISPNSKFADIKAIRKTQIKVSEVNDNSNKSGNLKNPNNNKECIIMAL
jgi:hypothetical protein